ncbi:hypothetical protein DEO72_LG11g1223 [Vigna unguiculata]|uniref:Uncharacterized protein n=1 Tax=Vigna unguiculata TaxID=3917 RepID=A0A4D6NNJ4_VIGUN|nr:hypothetical protein DEO72_LG11g1223 [Vigna unguiculata]
MRFRPASSGLGCAAAPEPPASPTSAPVYRVHDHRHTQADRSTCGKTCYGSYTATPGRVPLYEHGLYRPKTTTLASQQLRRAIHLAPSVLAPTSTLTPATLPNPSHTSRVPRGHPPSRATTQEMLFRATTQGIPGRVPLYEHGLYRPKTTKLASQQLRRAIHLDPSVLATTSTLTPATLANPSHNSRVPRVHLPSRATTQEMLFRATTQGFLVSICHPEPQLKRCYSEPQLKEYHVLNPYPEPQLKRCYSEPQLKEYHVLNPYPEPQLKGYLPDRLAGVAYRQAPSASKHVTSVATAWRVIHYRLAPMLSFPTVTAPSAWRNLPLCQAPLPPVALGVDDYRLAVSTLPPGAIPVAAQNEFQTVQPDYMTQFPQKQTFSLNQEKRHSCTTIVVAWRQAPCRQAVHQFWKFPDFCNTPSGLQTPPRPHNFTWINTARPFIPKPRNDKNPMRCLAAGSVPPGGFPSRTPKPA